MSTAIAAPRAATRNTLSRILDNSDVAIAVVVVGIVVMMIVPLSTTVLFANWPGFRSDTWRASEYLSFMCWFLLGMGITFELPLVFATVVKISLVDAAMHAYHSMLRRVRGVRT